MRNILFFFISLFVVGYFLTNDNFHLLPKGNIPGALDLMQKSVEKDKVQAMFDKYDQVQEGDASKRMVDGTTQEMVDAYYNVCIISLSFSFSFSPSSLFFSLSNFSFFHFI